MSASVGRTLTAADDGVLVSHRVLICDRDAKWGAPVRECLGEARIESTLNGNARVFNVAADGRLLVVEEATTLDAIPAAAKAAIQKNVGGGTVTTVETFAKPGRPLLYVRADACRRTCPHGAAIREALPPLKANVFVAASASEVSVVSRDDSCWHVFAIVSDNRATPVLARDQCP